MKPLVKLKEHFSVLGDLATTITILSLTERFLKHSDLVKANLHLETTSTASREITLPSQRITAYRASPDISLG